MYVPFSVYTLYKFIHVQCKHVKVTWVHVYTCICKWAILLSLKFGTLFHLSAHTDHILEATTPFHALTLVFQQTI